MWHIIAWTPKKALLHLQVVGILDRFQPYLRQSLNSPLSREKSWSSRGTDSQDEVPFSFASSTHRFNCGDKHPQPVVLVYHNLTVIWISWLSWLWRCPPPALDLVWLLQQPVELVVFQMLEGDTGLTIPKPPSNTGNVQVSLLFQPRWMTS